MAFSSDKLKEQAAKLRAQAEQTLKDARERVSPAAKPVGDPSAPPRPSLVTTVQRVVKHANTLVKLQLELASLEFTRKTKALLFGALFGLGALFFAFFGLLFAFATIAAALATFLDWWLALLIVTGMLLLMTGVLVTLAIRKFKSGALPIPKAAISEAKLTAGALKR